MNLKEIVLGIAILVLTIFVTTYGVNMIFSEPQYESICSPTLWEVEALNETSCFEMGGKWIDQNIECIKAPCPQGYCDKEFSCRGSYELQIERYHMNVFLVAVPLGVLLILFGAYFLNLEAVGVGIMAGGVGTVLRGVGSYWRYSEDWIRFLISLAGLLIIIYFGYKFRERIGSKGSKDSKRKKGKNKK
ncbi:MAG: hypothetical protein Q8Q04_00525 [archaeon]|nr:hypothetical protein [archaeon]